MIVVIFFLIFSISQATAVTVIEQGVAASIQNTLSATAVSPSYDTEASEKAVEDYNRRQNERENDPNFNNRAPDDFNNSYNADNNSYNPDNNLDNYSENIQIPKGGSDSANVDANKRLLENNNNSSNKASYDKKGLQILYTKKCTSKDKTCNRGAVLTNIKSIVFDYNNRRGLYAKVPKNKEANKNEQIASQKEQSSNDRGLASEPKQ